MIRYGSKNLCDEAHVISKKEATGEVYVHYLVLDKRFDEWIPESSLRPTGEMRTIDMPMATDGRAGKGSVEGVGGLFTGLDGSEEIMMSEEDYDFHQHKKVPQQRNFEYVFFANWAIKTWYYSPYPLIEKEQPESDKDREGSSTPISAPHRDQFGRFLPGYVPPTNSSTASSSSAAASSSNAPAQSTSASFSKSSHKMLTDLFSGGLVRKNETGYLWVCENCFKYMMDKDTWSVHRKDCKVYKPPGGKRVYHRDNHSIWEVDGATSRLYCQCLALFGKLFIDVKTIWYDLDTFLFYITTVEQKKDHHTVVGYFSKEKKSFDDYNLNCIMTIPSYQRQGYGMLMIEFSYELSRRAGKIEGPERPLSDLGLRCYLAYWVASIIRFFRRALSANPPDFIYPFDTIGDRSFTVSSSNPNKIIPNPSSSSRSQSPQQTRRTNKRHHSSVTPTPTSAGGAGMGISPADPRAAIALAEHYPSPSPSHGLSAEENPAFTTERFFTHDLDYTTGAGATYVSVRCTLEEIARATMLHTSDVAFALNEVGLLCKEVEERWNAGWDRRFGRDVKEKEGGSGKEKEKEKGRSGEAKVNGIAHSDRGGSEDMDISVSSDGDGEQPAVNGTNASDVGGGEDKEEEKKQEQDVVTINDFVSTDPESGERMVKTLVITREMIEEVAENRKVKKPILDDLRYVHL